MLRSLHGYVYVSRVFYGLFVVNWVVIFLSGFGGSGVNILPL